jgi:hypothetical protein
VDFYSGHTHTHTHTHTQTHPDSTLYIRYIILEGLANLAMKPNETTNELLTRITITVRVIKESFADYGAITPDPLNYINHGISNQTFRTLKRQYTAMMFNFFKRNLFKAALTPELRAVVAQQDPEQMTVKKMYMCATTAQREGKTKPPAAINKDDVPVEAMDDENDVTAFNRRGARPKTSQSSGQSCGGYTLLDEEVTNLDQDQKEEEIQVAETTPIEMVNSATSARSKGTNRRNAGKDS